MTTTLPYRTGHAQSNGIEIYYEDTGPLDAPPVVLVMGLAAQHVFWPESIVNGLLQSGFRVIKLDNRDVGLSTKIKTREYDRMVPAFVKSVRGQRIRVPYRLYDMVEDTAGLLDALDIRSAHLVGASMGGMIAQLFAALHRERTRSLSTIFSSTLHPKLPKPRLNVLWRLATSGAKNRGGRDAAIQQTVDTYRIINGRGFKFNEALVRERATTAYDRCFHPWGHERQAVGILATGSFEPLLSRVRAPTCVIHGDDDPLVHVDGGRATAHAIRDAKLHIVKGMGHGMPEQVIPDLVGWIGEAVRRGESA